MDNNLNKLDNKNPKLTNQTLKEWILRQFGYPTRNVELDDAQLDDCIEFAMEEIQPQFSTLYYLTIDVRSSAIDLSEYNVFEVYDVIKIPTEVVNAGSAFEDPFSYGFGGLNGGVFPGYGLIGNTTNYISRITNSDIHHVISAYAQQYNELFYSKLAYILQQRTAGSIYPNMNYEYNRHDKTLYISPGYPSCKLCTIEYVPYVSDVSQLVDNRYIRIARDLALGQAMTICSRVVGKYDVSNSPAKVNYEMMREDGEKYIENAKAELKRISKVHYITD